MSKVADQLRESIVKHSHRIIIIQPRNEVSERLGTMNELEKFVRHHNVSIRGWNFPFVAAESEEYGYQPAYFWSATDFGELRETWQLHKDGSFIGWYGERALDQAYQEALVWGPKAAKFSFSITDVIYTCCEYAEFTKRLSIFGRFNAGATISITYKDKHNTGLGSDMNRVLSGNFICRDFDWTDEITGSRLELEDEVEVIAARFAQMFFRRYDFKMKDETLANIQEEFYALRIGDDRSRPYVTRRS